MAFKYPPDERTPEEIEAHRLDRELERIKKRTEAKQCNIRHMARTFYEEWIKVEHGGGVSKEEMAKLAKRAWDAAETYFEYSEERAVDWETNDD